MKEYSTLAQLALYLKEERLKQEYSLNQLADITGLTKSHIIRIEKGENVTILTLLKVAEALKIQLAIA